MDNVTQPAAGGSKTGMWVALVIAVIALGVGAYFLFASENGANANNSNVVVNENANAAANQNFNSMAIDNSNSTVNRDTNVNLATNTATNRSGWNFYTDIEYSISLQYPSDWQALRLSDQVVGMSPKNSDYEVEGSPAHAITIVTSDNSVAEQISSIPTNEVSDVIVNGLEAKRHLDNQGVTTFYFNSIHENRSFSISDNSSLLELSGTVTESEFLVLNALFDSILTTITHE